MACVGSRKIRPPYTDLETQFVATACRLGFAVVAGFALGAVISAETNSGVEEILAELSLALKSGFPETETVLKRRRGSNVVVAPR